MKTLIMIASLALLATSSAFAGHLTAYTASYAIYHNGSKVGTSIKTLSYPSSHQYSYTSDTQVNVTFYHQHYLERSVGDVTGHGYQPMQYLLKTNNKLTYQTEAFSRGLQDNLSQALMLSYYLLNGQTPKTLRAVTAAGTQTYAFQVIQKNAVISTPLGKLDATQVRFQDEKGDQVDEWLAKKYEYLPALIQVSKSGKVSGMIYLMNIGQ